MEVLSSGASLRVNDRERLEAIYPKTVNIDLDFDAYMTIGFVNNQSYGEVALLNGRIPLRQQLSHWLPSFCPSV